HANHGIGIYAGISGLTFEGAKKDYIKIQYAGSDVLYVPCNQLDMVSKYIGAGAEAKVKLSKMGSKEWQRAKSRAKSAAKNIAKELILLYAARKNQCGYAFPPDCEYQDEFESAFEYSETDGQLTSTEEIKADMESSVPMDRLLCGDVGFGKTEVALRAAFKAVCDGKQVAILVPTTILALQHYNTMKSRFRGFPVAIGMLSRFKTKKEQDNILPDLKNGKLDIIVGTHKLLQKSIEFKDLGLLVIDEEQRFGVSHKEKLKALAVNVDTLTLTATPIPRTLNMALSGIRDMSVLEEAPQDRVPVQSFVLEHDDEIIYEAIRRELRRGGQVFYLHNVVDSMYGKASELAKQFPSATVGVANGQMDKNELSDIWHSMVNGEIDILVCTTIIETGVDIPNANTLIIEEANKMGLSQLHQIRGRVGRSPRRAYAYFTYRAGSLLSEIATKRLGAIKEFTEFGSGFKIAMRDLELRGAGNLLGAEQSGHMAAIGYDLYIKILEEAVNEEKGIINTVKRDCLIEIICDAYIPDDYISSSQQRIDMYRKIALLDTKEDRDDLVDEFLDRFGELPESVSNLLDISLSRNIASALGINHISQKGGSYYVLCRNDLGLKSFINNYFARGCGSR
ncbi:MAG: transcription-repair coupling factor, partial [Clostridia bacterium]